MPNYLNLLGEYYPDTNCYTSGDPTNYTDLVWVTSQISQADLDVVCLIDVKTIKILEMAEFAKEEIVAGFVSSALTYPHWYDSAAEDQLNLIGAVATDSTMPYSCRASTQGYQIVDVGSAIIATDSTGFLNDTTSYDAEIVIDGVSVYVSISGVDAQTHATLLTAIQADLALGSELSSIALVNGNYTITSDSWQSTSTVDIIDTTLFVGLTQYVGINTAVIGIDASTVMLKSYKNHTHAELLTVINDGKDVKLAALQKFNVKKAQILAATNVATVATITWT